MNIAIDIILALIAAWLTALWFVYKALGCVEFLFAGCEYKFSAALFADEFLVFVHGVVTSL